jgi:hypothetical protein
MFVRNQRLRRPNLVEFSQINIGNAFRFQDEVYVKVNDNAYYNALQLGENFVTDIERTEHVEPTVVKFSAHAIRPEREVKTKRVNRLVDELTR